MEHKVAVLSVLLLVVIQLACIDADTASRLVPGRCRPRTCKLYCRYGFIMDSNNCPTCSCRILPRPKPSQCGPVCMIFCQYGNILDSRGCPTCKCKPGPAA
ncbi:unnamed protein product [Candidula unifasciata]|uniref:Antistasin-like domain-containing protein n=1 Tax=Candidula unifasciata TaxID=100452 RepID=A0A8S4A4V0_9EUPU|nr:unnamed protein product [Candidula unifasciata]